MKIKHQEDKERVIQYIRRFPFYKWAAKSIGKDADTLLIWRKEDADFSVRLEAARAEGVSNIGKRATPDFLLACADPETFSKTAQLEVKGNITYTFKVVRYMPENGRPALS